MTRSSDDISSAEETDDPSEAALNWLIALQDEPDAPELKARFETWLAADPHHRAAWDEVRTVWTLVGRTTPVHVEPSSGAALPRGQRAPRRRFAATAAVMGAAALMAWLMIVLLPGALLRLDADAVTAVGETRQMTLADGSTLHLGADSAVDIVYSDDARRIRLLAGTVFVEVSPDAARPFTVIADGFESTALGTAYEVRRMDDGTMLTVARGAVAADHRRTSLSERLRAGDWLRVDGLGAVIGRGTASADRVAAWRDGRLFVKDWPLGDVVQALRHHFHGAIVVLGGALSERRVTGVYDLADPVDALRAAAYPHGVAVRRLTPWLLVVSGG